MFKPFLFVSPCTAHNTQESYSTLLLAVHLECRHGLQTHTLLSKAVLQLTSDFRLAIRVAFSRRSVD